MKLSAPGLFTLLVFAWVCGCYLADCRIHHIEYVSSEPDAVAELTKSISSHWFELIYLSSFFSLAAFLRARPLVAMIALVIPWLGFAYALNQLPVPKEADLYWQKRSSPVELEVELLDNPSKTKVSARSLMLIAPVKQALEGKVQLEIASKILALIDARKGDRCRVTGTIFQIRKRQTAWELDLRSILRRKNIFCRLKVESIEKSPSGNSGNSNGFNLFREIDRCREAIIKTHRTVLGRERGDLLSSIVLGDRSTELPKQVKEDFRKTGLSHLLAASGFNLSILVGTIYFLLGKISRSRLKQSLASILAIAGFVCLAGASASVTRAAAMGIILVMFRAFYRKANSAAVLSLTLLTFTLLEPVSLLDVGLQLSYAATYGIILGIGPIHDSIKKMGYGPVPRFLLELCSVILLAQGAVLPIQLYYFWELGLTFIIANLMLDPAVAPITVGGFISSSLVILSQVLPTFSEPPVKIATTIDNLLMLPLQYMLNTASILASWKNNVLITGPPHPSTMIFYGASYLLLIKSLNKKHSLSLALSLFCLALSLLILNIPQSNSQLLIAGKSVLLLVRESRISCIAARRKGRLSRSLTRCLKYHGVNPVAQNPADEILFVRLPKHHAFLTLHKREDQFRESSRAETYIRELCEIRRQGNGLLFIAEKWQDKMVLKTTESFSKSIHLIILDPEKVKVEERPPQTHADTIFNTALPGHKKSSSRSIPRPTKPLPPDF